MAIFMKLNNFSKISIGRIVLGLLLAITGLFLLILLALTYTYAKVPELLLPSTGVMSSDPEHFLDPNIDYSKFVGRVTDRDSSGQVIKIKTENNNIKFFRSGDAVNFSLARKGDYSCQGYVRGLEDYYVALYVVNIQKCLPEEMQPLRIGSELDLQSKVLQERILYGSQYRMVLLKMHKDLLYQLNDLNNSLVNYQNQRLQTSALYDKEINNLKRAKQQALDKLLWQQEEKVKAQSELKKRLTEINENIKFYQIEREEYITDRWHLDQDLGLPVENRPPLNIISKQEEFFY